ncbi:hypothetical protein [Streptomyces sp. 6N106]|uniref:hypothetical protein n=1 Tax=Streptomyces sp. 6N106 TaxID=3457418 RepID=UPI003FD22B53
MTMISSSYFPADAEQHVLAESTVVEKWRRVLIEAFSIRYKVDKSKVPSGLGFTANAYFNGMNGVIEDWVSPLVSIRNSLAHGQWVVAFNSDNSDVNVSKTGSLRRLTLWHIRLQKNMLDHLERLVFDLVVTRYAFERDFDKHWSNLIAAQNRIETGKSAAWEQLLRRRHVRGKRHRARNFVEGLRAGNGNT